MDYIDAVRLARAGDERGFGYLYENTYKSKYYLALRYMKNREAAEDVLQDSYLRAFSKLDTLNEPEHFPAWLGQIVANTAKNALARNNPVLFTDVAVETEIDDFEEWIEDSDITSQPELSYTREETRTLVHELIDSLSEEQRLCVLMFHIEGIPIKEIACILGCSENTVKSRLNYGRKNIKVKAEELQKKGYKLYTIAPLPLLLYLFRSDFSFMLAETSIQTGGQAVAKRIFAQLPNKGVSAGTGQAQNAPETLYGESGEKAATRAVKAGFLHTTAGKIAVAVLGICIVGGTVYGISQMLQTKEALKPESKEADIIEGEKADEMEGETEEPQPVSVADGDYPELLEGRLTKAELEFVFAYGPETLTEQGLSEDEYLLILNCMCGGSKGAGGFIASVGMDTNYRSGWNVDDLNRFMSSFTDYRFTEDNDSDTPYGTDVDGDTLWMFPAELSFEATAKITDAAYLGDTMVIHFSHEKNSYEGGLTTTEKTATLKKDGNGKFRIITIEEGNLPANWGTETKEDTETADQAGNTGDTASIRAIYEGVLRSVQNQEAGYDFPNAGGSTDYQYFLWDMDGDGIKELVVGAMFAEDVFEVYDIRVFTAAQSPSGYGLKPLTGDLVLIGPYLPSDGKGLYSMEMSRGTGETNIYRITIKGDTLSKGNAPELSYTMGDNTGAQFINTNAYANWMSISDLSGLDGLK